MGRGEGHGQVLELVVIQGQDSEVQIPQGPPFHRREVRLGEKLRQLHLPLAPAAAEDDGVMVPDAAHGDAVLRQDHRLQMVVVLSGLIGPPDGLGQLCAASVRCRHERCLLSVQRRQQIQQLREPGDDCVRTVFLRKYHGMLFFRGAENDIAADPGLLGAGDVPLDVVRYGDTFAGLHAKLPQSDPVDLRAGLAEMADRGQDHAAEIGIQPVLLQPVGDLMLADQVGDDAQPVAPGVQGLDDLSAAVHQHTAPLGLPVLEGELVADLGDADINISEINGFLPMWNI